MNHYWATTLCSTAPPWLRPFQIIASLEHIIMKLQQPLHLVGLTRFELRLSITNLKQRSRKASSPVNQPEVRRTTDDMEIGDDVAALIPDKPRPGPLRHLEHVERERVLPAAH